MNRTEPGSALPVSRWRWLVHLILIGGLFLPGLAFSSRRPAHQAALTGNVRGLLFVSGINFAIFAVLFAIAWLFSRASREQMFLRWRPGWWVVPLGFGYSIAIRLVLAITLLMAVVLLLLTHVVTQDSLRQLSSTKLVDVEKLVDKSAMQNQPAYYWLTVTLVSFIVAGVREELWRAGTFAAMRALWPRLFTSRLGEIVAIALIAVVFGAAHLVMGWVAAVAAGVLGLLLGLIIIVHRSVWPAVIAHGCFDALSLALLPLVFQKLHSLG